MADTVDDHVRAGRLDDAAALLEAAGRFDEAGWVLLSALPRVPTPVDRLAAVTRASASRAAENFALAKNTSLARGLYTALGLAKQAAKLDADTLGESPWPPGVLFSLNPFTRRGFDDPDDLLRLAPRVDGTDSITGTDILLLDESSPPDGEEFVFDLSAKFIELLSQPDIASEPSIPAVDLGETLPPRPQPQVASKVRVGDVLSDRYRLDRVLGVGASAKVFAAVDLDLQEPVALKLFERLGDDPEDLRRFLREIRISRRLSHPNLTRLFEFNMRGGLYFLTMELHAGVDLARYLESRGGSLPPRDATLLMAQAASGLQAAHDEGVLHRDIKPSNLFVLFRDHRLKILDFGFARSLSSDDSFENTRREGSPIYMSPEAMRGAPDIGPASDLYSLGVVFYEVLTGRRTAEGLDGLLRASMGALPTPPHEIDPAIPLDLSDVVMRLLAPKPSDRFSSARKLQIAMLATSAVRS